MLALPVVAHGILRAVVGIWPSLLHRVAYDLLPYPLSLRIPLRWSVLVFVVSNVVLVVLTVALAVRIIMEVASSALAKPHKTSAIVGTKLSVPSCSMALAKSDVIAVSLDMVGKVY